MLKSNCKSLRIKANLSKYMLSKMCNFYTTNNRVNVGVLNRIENNKGTTVENALKVYTVLKQELPNDVREFEDVFFLEDFEPVKQEVEK